MGVLDRLKKIFPKPIIPQKRYLMLAGLIIYAGLKIYVNHTEAEWDNKALEAGKGIVLEYFAAADKQPDPSTDYDEDGLRYGEGYR